MTAHERQVRYLQSLGYEAVSPNWPPSGYTALVLKRIGECVLVGPKGGVTQERAGRKPKPRPDLRAPSQTDGEGSDA